MKNYLVSQLYNVLEKDRTIIEIFHLEKSNYYLDIQVIVELKNTLSALSKFFSQGGG